MQAAQTTCLESGSHTDWATLAPSVRRIGQVTTRLVEEGGVGHGPVMGGALEDDLEGGVGE